MNFFELKIYILRRIEAELPPNVHYHDLKHTIDVYRIACALAAKEKVYGENLILLKTAVLLHDIGFVKHHKNHEETSCEISKDILPHFNYSNEQIERICAMIMATKIPQSPKNHLEKIICDADLDYLGRDDFPIIAQRLYKELESFNLIDDEINWNRLQLSFLTNHRYFTETAKNMRTKKKREHLNVIKKIVGSYDKQKSGTV
jgi:uncharacterized protein